MGRSCLYLFCRARYIYNEQKETDPTAAIEDPSFRKSVFSGSGVSSGISLNNPACIKYEYAKASFNLRLTRRCSDEISFGPKCGRGDPLGRSLTPQISQEHRAYDRSLCLPAGLVEGHRRE